MYLKGKLEYRNFTLLIDWQSCFLIMNHKLGIFTVYFHGICLKRVLEVHIIMLSSEKLEILVFSTEKKISFKNILNSNGSKIVPCKTSCD